MQICVSAHQVTTQVEETHPAARRRTQIAKREDVDPVQVVRRGVGRTRIVILALGRILVVTEADLLSQRTYTTVISLRASADRGKATLRTVQTGTVVTRTTLTAQTTSTI